LAGKATFKMVAAGDGSPQSPSGYGFLVFAHAIATVLLLIVLVAGVWEFMDWVVTPSCPGDAAMSSVASSAPAPAATTSPVAPRSVQAGESRRTPGRTGVSPTTPVASYQYSAQAELALSSGECPCPHQRQLDKSSE
jgi:hypothetical protein